MNNKDKDKYYNRVISPLNMAWTTSDPELLVKRLLRAKIAMDKWYYAALKERRVTQPQ